MRPSGERTALAPNRFDSSPFALSATLRWVETPGDSGSTKPREIIARSVTARRPTNIQGRRSNRGRCGVDPVSEARAGEALLDLDRRIRSRVEPSLRVALQATMEQVTDCVGDGVREGRPVGFRLQHGGEDVAHRLALEEAPTRQHLVEHDTESPDVGALVDGLAGEPAPETCRPPCRG